jgi:hypothetical protein
VLAILRLQSMAGLANVRQMRGCYAAAEALLIAARVRALPTPQEAWVYEGCAVRWTILALG